MGHRRLSINDLNTGDQPICNNIKSIVVIFNGEIYNYIELKEELVSYGYAFLTTLSFTFTLFFESPNFKC